MALPTPDRAGQLKALAAQFPAASQAQSAADQAARTNQMQQSIAGAAPGVASTAPVAAAIGTQTAQSGAQSRLQATQNANNTGVQLGQLALENRGQQLKGEAADRSLASSKEYQDYATRLNGLDQQLKTKLLDDQLNFKTNAAGQTQLNERQLMDYAVTKSKSDTELKKFQQSAEQAWAKKLYVMNTANAKIEQALKNEYAKSKQEQDQALILKLTKAQNDARIAAEKAQANARNKMAAWSAVGTIAGAVAGSAFGPTGAMVGASAGGAVGSLANSLFD